MLEEFKADTEITLFRHIDEKYETSHNNLTHDEFLVYLKNKKEVRVERNTVVIAYSLDKTNLSIKRFYILM
jgi:hypothetical protein